jgi:hypothetical protein
MGKIYIVTYLLKARTVQRNNYRMGKIYIVAYLLKARTVEPETQPLLGNCCVTCNNGVTV